MDALNEALLGLLTAVVTLMAGAITTYGVSWLKNSGLLAKMTKNKAYAKIAVQFVEQVYGDIDGDEKLAKAQEGLKELLGKAGLKMSDEQLRILIESAVKSMRDSANAELNKTEIIMPETIKVGEFRPIDSEGYEVKSLTEDELKEMIDKSVVKVNDK